MARCGSIGFDGLDSMVVVCGSVVSLGMNLMGSHGLPWVRWLWLDVGRRGWGGRGSPWVVLARCGSIGFDGLVGLDGSLWVDWV